MVPVVTCIEGLLAQLAGTVEREVKEALGGLAGMFVRGYLPQTWNVATDDGSATFTVDAAGNARAAAGLAAGPDVTIEGSHRAVSAALRGDRTTAGAYRNEARVTTHTNKGAAAWSFLRQRLGF